LLYLKYVSTAKARCSTDPRSMATEMLWIALEERSRTNSPRQRFHSQLFCKIVGYFCRTLYINIGANNGNEKLLTKKNNATSGKLIKVVYVSYVYIYIILYKLVTWYYWSTEIKENGVSRACDVHERVVKNIRKILVQEPERWRG
jgi:hypothetical protein